MNFTTGKSFSGLKCCSEHINLFDLHLLNSIGAASQKNRCMVGMCFFDDTSAKLLTRNLRSENRQFMSRNDSFHYSYPLSDILLLIFSNCIILDQKQMLSTT